MRRFRQITVGVIVLILAKTLWGHPPTDLKLDYDIDKKNLHIEMTHVTGNIREHYIRKLIVSLNQKEIISETIVRQTTPHNFLRDIPLDANPNDVITVKAICKEGGSAEASITIPAPEEKKERQP